MISINIAHAERINHRKNNTYWLIKYDKIKIKMISSSETEKHVIH